MHSVSFAPGKWPPMSRASLSAERMRELQSLAVQKVSARLPDASAETEMRFKRGLKRLLGVWDARPARACSRRPSWRARSATSSSASPPPELLALAAAYEL